jgi:uncharacterized protein YbjT (DUF2867 family)
VNQPGHVMLIGATGLVGRLALAGLLERAGREDFHIYVPTRRALGVDHPQLRPIVVALDSAEGLAQIEDILQREGARLESFASALGTTRRAAGSDAAFAAVDRDLVMALAGIAHRHGARQAVVVSSIGADPASPSFYLRVKGEMEAGVLALGFERADFLQPGLLLGQREGAVRRGERLAQQVVPLFNPLLIGPLARLRAIRAEAVAAALVALVGRQGAGVLQLSNRAIEELAGGLGVP